MGLTEKDLAMLSRHAEDLASRERESRARAEEARENEGKKEDERSWTVETPRITYHDIKGSPASVKKGDKADITGRGTRRMSHPIGNEKLPLPA